MSVNVCVYIYDIYYIYIYIYKCQIRIYSKRHFFFKKKVIFSICSKDCALNKKSENFISIKNSKNTKKTIKSSLKYKIRGVIFHFSFLVCNQSSAWCLLYILKRVLSVFNSVFNLLLFYFAFGNFLNTVL